MLQSRRIYIVDDNDAFARFCSEVANLEGWRPVICANGRELLDALDQGTEPALVLLDINMPEMDGIEVIDEIKNCPRDLKLRFVTGGPENLAQAAHMIANARGLKTGRFLTKPVGVQRLRDILGEEAALA